MSEVVKIRDLPENWIEVPIEECVEILDSQRIPLNSKQRASRIEGKSQNELFPYYGATGQVGYIDDYIFEGEHLLIGEDGAPFFDKSKNVAYIAKGQFWVNNHAHILGASEGITSNKYLLHYLNNFNYKGYVGGTTRLKLNQGNLKKIPVPLAPLEQQKRIVAKIEELFSHIDAGIEALNKAKQLLKQYRQSVLKAAVTGELTKEWREAIIKDDAQVSANVAGGRAPGATKLEPASQLLERILQERRQKWEEQQLAQFKAKAKGKMPKNDKWKGKYKEPVLPDDKRTHDLPESWFWGTFEQISERVTVGHVGSMKNEYVEQGIPFLRSQNVRENRYDPKGLKYVSESFHEKLQKSSLEPGDLVTVRSGSVGVTCVIPEFLRVANCSDLVIVKQPKAANPKYAAYYMNTITQTKVAAEKVGVALTHFNTKSMAEMPIPLPSLIEQVRIVELVDMKISDIEKLDSVIDEQNKTAEKNKQSILASAFSGSLIND